MVICATDRQRKGAFGRFSCVRCHHLLLGSRLLLDVRLDGRRRRSDFVAGARLVGRRRSGCHPHGCNGARLETNELYPQNSLSLAANRHELSGTAWSGNIVLLFTDVANRLHEESSPMTFGITDFMFYLI
jgi:hypothetical protein